MAGAEQDRRLQRDAEATRQQLEARAVQAEERLRIARLQIQLGLLLVEVEEKSLGKATEISTQFFDRVREALFASQDNTVRSKLEAALKRRDQVTADLTAAKPDLADRLRRFYAEFQEEGGAPPR